MTASFEQARFEKCQGRHANGAKQTGHGGHHVRGARLGKQKREAIEEALGIALKKAGKRGIKSAVGERSVHDHHPTIIGDKAMTESVHVLVFGVARKLFKGQKNIFEASKISTADRDATECFQKSSKERVGFRSLLFREGREAEFGQLFGKLIGPEALEERRKFAESRSDNAARGGIGMFQATGVIQENGARFPA